MIRKASVALVLFLVAGAIIAPKTSGQQQPDEQLPLSIL